MSDITEILTIAVKVAALLISAMLIPYLQTEWKGQKLQTVQKWLEIACNAAKQAQRGAITFDVPLMGALTLNAADVDKLYSYIVGG